LPFSALDIRVWHVQKWTYNKPQNSNYIPDTKALEADQEIRIENNLSYAELALITGLIWHFSFLGTEY